MEIKSEAFKNQQTIPKDYTCEGRDVSPALSWDQAPAGTKSIVLICDDPDAPGGTWVHWVMYNIPGESRSLARGIPHDDKLPDGSLQGINDFRKTGYGGPCPPPGKPHRYFFKLYALDTPLSLPAGATKQQVMSAMEGHIIDNAEIMGLYER